MILIFATVTTTTEAQKRLYCIFRYILAQALLELHGKENVTQAPSNCNKSGNDVWLTGKLLFEYIRKQILSSGRLLL